MREPLSSGGPLMVRINVTPIIDVALVLVIILLLTAPMLSMTDIDVKLPAAHTRGAEDHDRISVTLSTRGELALDDQRLPLSQLASALSLRLQKVSEDAPLVVVRADAGSTHGMVRDVMEQIKRSGAKRVAVATTQKGGLGR
jgi:biopolymer transport protein ExbD